MRLPTVSCVLSDSLPGESALARALHQRGVDAGRDRPDAVVRLAMDDGGPGEAPSGIPVVRVEAGYRPGTLRLSAGPTDPPAVDAATTAAIVRTLPPLPERLMPQDRSRDAVHRAMVQEALFNAAPRDDPGALADLVAPALCKAAAGEPRITVIVNNHNYAPYLGEALSSVLAQSRPAHEIVAVDDGSTDDSRAVLSAFESRGVTVVVKPNGGQASALNAGYARATGDAVLFLDADDRLHPDALRRLATAPLHDVARLSFGLRRIDAEGRGAGLYPNARRAAEGYLAGQAVAWGSTSFMPTSGNLFPRHALDAIMPMPEAPWRISADLYLVLACAFLGPARHIDTVLGDYRVHGRNAFYHLLGADPFLNPRKYAQRAKAARSLAEAMGQHRFGDDRLRRRLSALSRSLSHAPADRVADALARAGTALAALPSRVARRTAAGAPHRPPPAPPLARETHPALFGATATWRRIEHGSDLALSDQAEAEGVLGHGWRPDAQRGATLVAEEATLALCLAAPRGAWDVALDIRSDLGEPVTLTVWLNGQRLDWQSLGPATRVLLRLPSELLTFDARLQAYPARLVLCVPPRALGRLHAERLQADRMPPMGHGAPWVPEARLCEPDPYLGAGWDWPGLQGSRLVSEAGDMALSVSGQGAHTLFLRFDGPRPAVSVEGAMVEARTGLEDALAIALPPDLPTPDGTVRLTVHAMETGTALTGIRLDRRVAEDGHLHLGQPVPARTLMSDGGLAFRVPDTADGCLLWIEIAPTRPLAEPATLSVAEDGRVTRYVVGGACRVPHALARGPARRVTLHLDLPGSVDLGMLILDPRPRVPPLDASAGAEARARAMAQALDRAPGWHATDEGVYWIALPEVRLALPAPPAGATHLTLDCLAIPDPLQRLTARLGDGHAATAEGGRSALTLPVPQQSGPLELVLSSDTLIAQTALGIDAAGFVGGGVIDVAYGPSRTAATLPTSEPRHG